MYMIRHLNEENASTRAYIRAADMLKELILFEKTFPIS
jgi:hypothetical protein